MGCGCRNKNKAGGALQAAPVARRIPASQAGRPARGRLSAPQGSFYSRAIYYVIPEGSSWEADDAEKFMTLAEAQKTLRDRGPGWSVEAHRPGEPG